MRFRSLIATALTLVALAVVAGPSSAVSLSVEGAPRTIGAGSNGRITFSVNGFASVECLLSFSGTIRGGLIEKTAGTTIGSVTALSYTGCRGGEINALLIPWPLKYRSIAGTLPDRVTSIQFSFMMGIEFHFTAPDVDCLYSGEVFAQTSVTGRNPYTTGGPISITGDTIGGGSGICAFLPGDFLGRFEAISPALRVIRL